jgi:hypothetical protein
VNAVGRRDAVPHRALRRPRIQWMLRQRRSTVSIMRPQLGPGDLVVGLRVVSRFILGGLQSVACST